MKKIFIVISIFLSLLLLTSQNSFSQESNTEKKSLTKKLEKEKKKQEKEAAAQAERQKYAEMLQDKYFVFMANTLAGDAGATYSVTPKFNFLGVYGETAVFQFAFDGIVGWNGIGGITLTGEVDDYQFDPGKNSKKPMRVTGKMKSSTHWGRPYFTLSVFGGGYASITMTVKGGTINMDGQIVEPEDSGVYQGTEILIDK